MRLPLAVLAALARPAAPYCCFYPETATRCVNCQSIAEDSNYCAASETKCNECGHVWCAANDDSTAAATPVLPDGPEWQLGTYTTRYWDCCKPSCAWNGKGDVDRPVLACEAETGEVLTDANVASVCDGGTAASCASNQPWTYNDGVSLGFAAAAVSGNHGLNGDENCGQCYELVWSNEGGAHPDIVGKSHIIQVTNCVEINQCAGCTQQFFTKSFLGDDAAVQARSNGEEPASPRHRAGVASMAWKTTR